MARSITGTITLAVTLAFAIPVFLLGLDFVTSGRQLGWAFVALAALMVVVEELLVTPGDVPGMVAKRIAGTVVVDPDAVETGDGTDAVETGDGADAVETGDGVDAVDADEA